MALDLLYITEICMLHLCCENAKNRYIIWLWIGPKVSRFWKFLQNFNDSEQDTFWINVEFAAKENTYFCYFPLKTCISIHKTLEAKKSITLQGCTTSASKTPYSCKIFWKSCLETPPILYGLSKIPFNLVCFAKSPVNFPNVCLMFWDMTSWNFKVDDASYRIIVEFILIGRSSF